MATTNLSSTAYANHLRGCADLAKEIATRMDIREDSARQAMLATLIISADRHNIFMEPTPPNGKPTAAAPDDEAAVRDEAAAQKADAQIKDAPRNPTPEQADGAKRAALLAGITQGRDLLNKAGYTPIMTPKALNGIINDEMNIPGDLGSLDTDQLESVVKMLATRLETFKSNMKAIEADAPF